MELSDIKKIVELMNEHDLSLFHLEKDDFNLKLKKGIDADAIAAAMPAYAPAPIAAAPAPAAAPAAPTAGGDSAPAAPAGLEITSPMVGTFYIKPAPDADPFVAVGSTVAEGDTICIIEAMKVMNEITADKAGTITAIVAQDGTPVQFGDTLFQIQ